MVGGEWLEFDFYMNFFVGGLCFECNSDVVFGDFLMIEFCVGDLGFLWCIMG